MGVPCPVVNQPPPPQHLAHAGETLTSVGARQPDLLLLLLRAPRFFPDLLLVRVHPALRAMLPVALTHLAGHVTPLLAVLPVQVAFREVPTMTLANANLSLARGYSGESFVPA